MRVYDWFVNFLTYNVHRWYQSDVGTYTRPDPIRLLAGANNFLYGPNRYFYAEANPLVLVDLLGLYGTNDGSYYDQRCQECGGYYYCNLAPRASQAERAEIAGSRSS